MMSSRIEYYFKRYKEEGFKNSVYLFYKKIQRVIWKRYVRLKILNAEKLISNEKFFGLIDLTRGELKNVRSSLQNKNYEGAKSEFINYLKVRKRPKFFFDPKEKEEIVKTLLKNFPEEVKETIKKADLICQHRFKWLTPNCPDFGEKIRWHSNFLDEREWALDFYMDLDYSSEKRLGDIRQVWELNRHQYFVTLGKAYWITSDETYAAEFVNQLADWINENPYGYGINWLHSQEVAIRAVSWIWAFYFFSDFPGFDVEKKIVMLKSLYQHAEYILGNLSDNPVTNNHLITEVCGLAIIGIMFLEFKKAKKWRDIGFKIFEKASLKLIWEDGVSGELATNYHLFVLDSFLQLSILMKKNGYSIPEDVNKRIEKMVEYVMYLCKPDGTIPQLGDSDSGRAFKLSEYNIDDRRGYLSTGAVVFGRGDFKEVANAFYEESFWLLGPEGLEFFEQIKGRLPKETSKLFKPSGVAILRKQWTNESEYIVLRGGPTKLRKWVSIGHIHADSLSFEFFANGKSIIVDPGTYAYSLEDTWRHYFRKTVAHNTLCIDDQDQADVSKRFGVTNFPLSQLHCFSSNNDFAYIDMSHAGYDRFGIIHRRKLLWLKKKYLLILDELRGRGRHKIDSYFHIDHEKVFLDEERKTVNIMGNTDASSVSIMPIFPDNLALNILNGQVQPIIGWGSYRYGEKHPVSAVRYSLTAELPLVLCFLISTRTTQRIAVTRFLWEHFDYEIKVQFDNSTDEIFLDHRGNIDIQL